MANVTIADLAAASGVTADDLIEIENDPSGTPGSQKATAAQLLSYIQGAISVPISGINATGTASASTYLRGDGTWAVVAGGGGGLENLVEDTSPQLGGHLDMNSQSILAGALTITATELGHLDGVTSNIQTQLNGKQASGSYAAASHTHAASDVTSGTFANARISEGSVTQHQAALSVSESQISDLGSYATNLSGLSDVDATVGSPSDGDILVYRSAGSDWVLEAKPAAGSNPALADITDWPSDVDATEVGYLNGVTSAIQTQLDSKQASGSYEPANVDILKADEGDNLTAGYTSDTNARGIVTSGTVTPAPGTGEENFQSLTNGGAFTLAPPASPCTVLIEVTNNASAGAITTSGFTIVTGDTISTTDGDDFHFHITKGASFSHLHVVALQ